MSDSVEKTFIGRKRFDDVNQDTTVPVQNENKKIKIAVGNKDTNFKVPEKLVHKSDLKSKDVNKTEESK